MYGELVKELRDSAEWADHLALLMGRAEGDAHAPVMRKAADAIEELSKKYLASEVDNTNLTGWLAEEHAKHLWIPVTERLPEEVGKYLVCGRWRGEPTEIWVCEFMTLGCLKGWTNNAANPVVSHWMPLPPAPKEE